MADLNKVLIIGRLGSDPELKATKDGKSYLNMKVATTSKKQKNKESKTTWHSVVVFGKQAEVCGRFLKKGASVLVEGSIETSSYVDKEGIKRHSFSVVAKLVQFVAV